MKWLLLVMVLFLFGCPQPVEYSPIDACRTLQGPERDDCFLRIGMEGNVEACLYLEGAKKDECIAEGASVDSDGSGCAEIVDPELKDGCYASVGRVMLDSDLCNFVEDDIKRSTCLFQIAQAFTQRGQSFTIDVCLGIDNSAVFGDGVLMRNACVAFQAGLDGNIEACENLKDRYKDQCLALANR